ncbi:hypothetical protein HK101_006535 [Irineochytrium annulatum]|nr:hypothetical protein HK101_006535 [Irineochytrium annulatum]
MLAVPGTHSGTRRASTASISSDSGTTSSSLDALLPIPADIELVIASVVPAVAERSRRAAMEKEYRDAVGALEWGQWEKAFTALCGLAARGHEGATAWMDIERSAMRNPTGMEALAAWLESGGGGRRYELVFEVKEDDDEGSNQEESESQGPSLATRELAARWRKKAQEAREKLGLPPPKPASAFAAASSTSIGATTTTSFNPSSLFSSLTSSTTTTPSSIDNPDAAYAKALSSLSWGYYDTALTTLLTLASTHSHPPSIAYLNPSRSPLRDPAAMHRLACRLTEAGKGTPEEADANATAASWHHKAAEAGHWRSMCALARMRMDGTPGVDRDPFAALGLWVRAWDAARAGDAAYGVAVAYAVGVEVEVKGVRRWVVKRDDARAVEWAKRGCGQGHGGCLNLMGELTREGRGVKADDKEAVEWFRKAAEKGDKVGMFNLGEAYRKGVGIGRDDDQALLWLTRAAK